MIVVLVIGIVCWCVVKRNMNKRSVKMPAVLVSSSQDAEGKKDVEKGNIEDVEKGKVIGTSEKVEDSKDIEEGQKKSLDGTVSIQTGSSSVAFSVEQWSREPTQEGEEVRVWMKVWVEGEEKEVEEVVEEEKEVGEG